MNVLAYWTSANYDADTKNGYTFNFNSKKSTLHKKLGIGDRLWLVGDAEMDGNRVHQLRACLVISEQFENPPEHQYGKYAVRGDRDLSTYFAQNGPDATQALLQLSFESSKPIQLQPGVTVGNCLQSPRVLTAEDDRFLQEWAEKNLLPLKLDAGDSSWISLEGEVLIDQPDPIVQDEGGGILSSVEERLVIERYAMESAICHYIAYEWVVEDVSRREPFDLRCIHPDGTEIHVEVKGTKTNGTKIRLTSGEVEHARERGSTGMDLIIVANIQVIGAPGSLKATGGTIKLYDVWDVDSCTLRAIQFECAIPQCDEIEELPISNK